MTSEYGKCQRCDALGQVSRIGTFDPERQATAVLVLCAACAALFMVLNRAQRRSLDREHRRDQKHQRRWGTLRPGTRRRLEEAATAAAKAAARAALKPRVLTPEQAAVEKANTTRPAEKRSKGGIVLP